MAAGGRGRLDVQVEENVVTESRGVKLQLAEVAVVLSGEILRDLGREF